jgi:hypothetical protein
MLFKVLLLYMVSNYFWCQTTLGVHLQACTLVSFSFSSNLCYMQASIPKGDLTLNGGMFQQPPFPLPPLSKTQVQM